MTLTTDLTIPAQDEPVLVIWHDITSEHCGWFHTTADLEPATVFTVGFIHEYDDFVFKVVSSLCEHKDDVSFGHDTVIPRGCVAAIVPLAE